MPQTTLPNGVSDHTRLATNTDAGTSISEMFRTLRYHRGLILACVAVCVLCSVIFLLVKSPVYEGSAIVRIDPGRAGSLGLSDLVAPGNVDADGILHTEIAVIKSDGVALRTIRSIPDPIFQDYFGVSKSSTALPTQLEDLSSDQQILLDNFEGDIDAKQVEGTSLINVTFHASNPRTAATIVDTLVQAYTIQSFASRDNSVSQLRTWLSSQMDTLKNQVDAAQKKLAQYQEANNLVGTGVDSSNNTITDRLRILNQSLAAAQADRIEKESRVRAAASGNPSALATLFPNPNLNALQTSQGELTAKAAQMSAKFGPKYPPLIEINKQIASIDREITNNANTVRQRLQQEYAAAKNNQDVLQNEYDAQTRLAFGVNRNQAQYAVLQGDVTSSRELYDVLRKKMQEASVDADVNGINTVLVDSSRIPRKPVAPKKLLILAGSFILGLFAGIVAAFAAEAASDKLRGPGQIEKEVGLPVLGLLPSQKGDTQAGPLVTLRSPTSKGAEEFRKLRSALLFSLPQSDSKKILIASAVPGEGASDVAANLAVSLAQAGYRVLAVDADMRSPALHKEFGVENAAGLSGMLADPTAASSFSQPVKQLSSLYLLTAGPKIALPSEKLSSDAFRSALQQWESQFDFIVLQSSPLLVVSDGLSLAGLSDSVLLVARWGVTKLRTLTQVREVLGMAGARVAGVLIDHVPQSNMEDESYRKVADAYFA